MMSRNQLGHEVSEHGAPAKAPDRMNISETTAAITVLIVEDHPVFRKGVEAVVQTQPDMRVAGAVADATSALAQAIAASPNVVLVDLRLADANGLTLVAKLKRLKPPPKVLVLSSHEGDVMVTRAFKAAPMVMWRKAAPRGAPCSDT